MTAKERIAEILKFWFEDHGPADWFSQNGALDSLIQKRFSNLHAEAIAGKLIDWRTSPEGRLAEIIILDQFSRNLFRGTAKAFARDKYALELSKLAIEHDDDKKVSPVRRAFFYLPYMHSELLKDHEEAVRLYKALGDEENLKFELLHKNVIERFGRYPQRNAALGRISTPEEKAFLADSNSLF